MASIRKRELPSGKIVWQADYRDGEGRRRHKQFAKKTDADAYLLSARGQVRTGTHIPESDVPTLERAASLWLTNLEKRGRERATLDRYRQTYADFVRPKFGSTKLTAITAPAVQSFIDDLVGEMSLSSLKKVQGCLVGIFKYAVARGMALHNPARDAELPEGRREQKRVDMPTKTELRAIIACTPERWRPFIRLATLTGMRASELRGLLWSDVDLDGGTIHVRRRADKYNDFGPPKSKAGTRDIPLSAGSVALLREWRKSCPKGKLDLVFPNGEGNIEGHANLLHRVFWPSQEAAGVTIDSGDVDATGAPIMRAKYSLHALRHAAAALFIEQGFPPKKVQALMGHASIQMTFDTYGYLFPSEDDDRDAMSQIDGALFG